MSAMQDGQSPWACVQKFVREKFWFIVVAGVAVVVGIAISATYATAIDYTASLNFCAHTCHEMEATVYQEYTHSKHFKNEYGVVVACPQCHVPHDNWPATFWAKANAALELWPHFFGGYSNPAVFEKHRLELAKEVWAKFKATNARECKACHHYSNMVLEDQRPSVRAQHTDAMKADENCLDCHKGITHKKFEDPSDAKPAAGGFDIQ
jgi:nitrate/TMAO reductase-like tetraheme cytochrome c subunit